METKNVINFFCKLGYLFANCDGKYDNREKEFISNFITEMIKHDAITQAEGEVYLSSNYSSISFDETIKEFQELLGLLPEKERGNILNEFNMFIESLIEVDGTIAPEEQKLFERWKNAIA